MEKAAKIRLRLLGRFGICSGDEPPVPIRISSRKGCALLAYLALHPDRSVGRSQLATLLWADRPDKLARQSLRQCLTSLRTDLSTAAPDLLGLDGDAVELRLPAAATDAGVVLALAGSTELPDLVRVGELYRGTFLADLDLGVEPFDEWVRAERARIEAAAARAFEAIAESYDRLGDGSAALAAAERLTMLDPLREDWQRLALRLCARYRGRECAIAKAEAFTAMLGSELEVAPSSSTIALIDDIRRSAPASSPIVVAPPGSAEADDGAVPAAASSVLAGRRWPRRPLVVAMLSMAAVLGVAVSGWWSVAHHRPLRDSAADAGRVASPPAAQLAAASGLASVVVLPFGAEGDTAGGSAIADRFTSDLIDELSRAPSIRVISQQTSNLYRGKAVDVAEVGAELGVRYVVDGRVRLQGGKVRIGVALVDHASRLQVWSNRSEHPWADSFAAQDAVTRGLARALYMQLVAAEGRRATAQKDPGVDGLVAKGWSAIHRHNASSTTGEAKAYFSEALRRDPGNVAALIGLGADAIAAVADLNVAEQEPYLTRAEEFLDQALASNPESAGAHYWLGVAQKMRGQFDEALRSFSSAIKSSPSFAPAYAQAGNIEAQQGRIEDGLAKIRYAIELNPQDSAVGRWYMFAGQIELERDHFEAAVDWLSRAVAGMPRNARARASLAAAYALAGRMSDAARQVAEVRKLAPTEIDAIKGRSLLPLNGGWSAGTRRLSEGWRRALSAS